jgi:hypothetical protein
VVDIEVRLHKISGPEQPTRNHRHHRHHGASSRNNRLQTTNSVHIKTPQYTCLNAMIYAPIRLYGFRTYNIGPCSMDESHR